MAKTLSDFPEDFDAEQYRQDAEALGEEVAKYVQKGYANRLRKADIYTRRAFEEGYSGLNYQLQFGVIDQETYFEKLAALRDQYFSKSTQEWYKYTAEIYEYKTKMLGEYEKAVAEKAEQIAKANRERLEKARENMAKAAESYMTNVTENAMSEFEEIARKAESAVAAVDKAKNAYADKLETSFGTDSGYKTKTTKIHNYYPTGDTLVLTDYSLSALDEEIEKMRAFDETLTKLSERAESLDAANIQMFFGSLRELSVEDANRLASLLLAGDDETFLSYLSSFGERRGLSETIAERLYGAEYAKIAETMRTEMEGVYAKIPEGFFAFGEQAAENFAEGFAERVEALFSNVEWVFATESIGSDTAYSSHTYSPTYNLYGSGETVSEQLISARNAASLERLRIGE